MASDGPCLSATVLHAPRLLKVGVRWHSLSFADRTVAYQRHARCVERISEINIAANRRLQIPEKENLYYNNIQQEDSFINLNKKSLFWFVSNVTMTIVPFALIYL